MLQRELFTTPEGLKQQFDASLRMGEHVDCPCCGRYAQIYHRKFHSSMAYQLIMLYRMGGFQQFVHASKLILPNMAGIGDFTKAKYWGLIIPKDKAIYDTDTSRKTSGYWRITPSGQQFIVGATRIPREVLVFDDQLFGQTEETISIHEAIADKFDYQQLMEGVAA